MNETNFDKPEPADAKEMVPAEPLVPVEPSPLTAEELEDLKQRAAKANDHWDRLLRTTADFDNYRKRAAREKQDAVKFANEALLAKLIPILDSFDMALSAAQTGSGDTAQLLKGFNMIYQQFKGVLIEAGLEEIDAAAKAFDPNFHEAVAQQETPEVPEGHVVHQLRKGYKLKERLIRPASVIVAKQPASS